MRWIVTFLDAIVLAYSLYGIVVWKNVFPEYIHSEYAEKFSENGLDVALFVNVNPYIQFLRLPDCTYDVFIKKKWRTLVQQINRGILWKGGFWHRWLFKRKHGNTPCSSIPYKKRFQFYWRV